MTQAIRTRFAASLIANIVRSGVSFLTGLLLARWLGPNDYGRMAFLLASFMAFRQILDMATSSAFFTFLSQRQRSRRFVSLYWRWMGFQFLVSLLLVGLLPGHFIESIWKGEARGLVVLAFGASFMQNAVWPIASQMAEAQRETVRVQRLNTVVVVVHLGVVFLLWLVGRLALPLVFLALAVEWGVAGWIASRMYRSEDYDLSPGVCDDTAATVFREFWAYCFPFIPYVLLSFASDFADRWMLQHWGGASEQAYYAVASQFAAIALLATASVLRIFWKEIAEAHHRQDHSRVQSLYLKASRALYFIGAVVAGGLLPWAAEIIRITLGAAYAGGSITLMLMFLYPVHQSMGQIGGTMLYATGKSRVQVVLGLVFMGASLVAAYFTMAPAEAVVPGLGLASRGLSYKMVIMQVLQVNVLAWCIARIFGCRFDWLYQVAGLGLSVAAGWLAKLAVAGLVELHLIAGMVMAGLLYVLFIACGLYLMPWVAGLDRKDLHTLFTREHTTLA